MGGDGVDLRVIRRIARARDVVGGLADDVSRWFDARRDDARFARFTHQFAALRAVLDRMTGALTAEIAALPADVDAVYQRCREIERGALIVRRVFSWYAEKYDQRLDADSAAVLLAADEVVRSCWTAPFAALGLTPPTGPVPYLEQRFDALATPRVTVPADLRAPGDAIVAEYIRELPVPAIALPAWASRQAWWLVLAAHETGHLVQRDLGQGLEDAAMRALAEAAVASGAGDLAPAWLGWAEEAFADAYSVLMVGDQAAWAIDELQHSTPAELVKAPKSGDRYPPPAVRLALLGELCALAGVGGSWPTAKATVSWLDGLAADAVPAGARAAVKRHLAVAPAAAVGLLSLPVAGSTLRKVSGLRPDWFAAGSRVQRWSGDLRTAAPSYGPVGERAAARHAIAAGVRAWTTQPVADDTARMIHRNLVGLLPRCGEPGVLAAPPEPANVAAVAARLAGRLLGDMADAAAKDDSR
jgi:hypothetical protein